MHPIPVKILALLVIFMAVQTVFSQNAVTDSFFLLYKDLNKPDSVRIDAASRHAYNLFLTDTLLSNQWYETAKDFALKVGQPSLLVIPLSSKARARLNEGLYNEALPIWHELQIKMEKINFKQGIGSALYGKGLTYYYLQEFDTSIFIQKKALQIFTAIKRHDKALSCINNLASSYLMQGNYPAALENYLKAYKIADELRDTANMIIIGGNCGMVHKYLGKYQDAKKYYQQTFELAKKANDLFQEANLLQKLGTLLDSQDSSHAAIELYRQALYINTANGYERSAGENQSNIGIAFFELGIFDSAWFYLQKSLPTLKKFGDRRGEGTVLSYLGKVLFSAPAEVLASLGISHDKAFAASRQLHQQALRIFQEIETPYNEASEWEDLANIYQKEGKYKHAFEAMKYVKQLKDSIFKDETKEKILETELKFEQEKREALLLAEHAAEMNERKLMQNATFAGGIIAVIATAGIYYLNRKRLKAKAARKESELAAEKVELENKALRSQMNPHFIFNALNSIADFVRKNEGNMAEEYLAKFARLMRLVLENSEHKEVLLSSDLEALYLYIQLEALRAGKTIEYNVVLSPDIDIENTLVPPLLLQPYVENSIWHGIVPKNGDGKLKINIAHHNGQLEFSIEDNGVGLSKAGKQQHSLKGLSMGMKLTERRIQLFTNTRPENQNRVRVKELIEGIRIDFQIPYKPSF